MSKHLCTCCYLQGKKEYMLDAKAFGIKSRQDYFPMYLNQGAWTRCLECREVAGVSFSETQTVGNKDQHYGTSSNALNMTMQASTTTHENFLLCPTCFGKATWVTTLLPNSHGCSKCHKVFDENHWNRMIIQNHRRYSDRNLVCAECCEKGFSSKNCEEYECQQCRLTLGSLKFDKNFLANFKRGHVKSCNLICIDCKEKHPCAACKVGFPKSYWNSSEKNHHKNKQQHTLLVCKACRRNGYSAVDVQTYTCQACKKPSGCTHFDINLIRNFKNHGRSKLLCKPCLAAENLRVKNLQKKLKRSKRLCNCFRPIHVAKCPLSPCYFNEKRWPGNDGWITEQERAFLDKLIPQPVWWKRAWGKV